MTDEYISTIKAIADMGGVSWNTGKKWTGAKGFPSRTAKGWDRGDVEAWIVARLEHSAKCQTGSDADLKREILKARLLILKSDLASREIALSHANEQTVPRDVMVAFLYAYTGAVHGALRSWRDYLANNPAFGCTPEGYDVISDQVRTLLDTMRRNVEYFLDSPTTAFEEPIEIQFTEDEKLKCSESFRYQA